MSTLTMMRPNITKVIRGLIFGLTICTGIHSSKALTADISVPAGDSLGLVSAISAANESPDLSIIRLSAGSAYLFDLPREAPEPIRTPIVILGNGAHIAGAGPSSFGTLFSVLEQGSLDLSELTIRDFRGNSTPSTISLISNLGDLIGRDLRVEHLHVQSNGINLSGVFLNRGRLILSRTRIVDVTVESSDHFVTIALYNTGAARLENVLVVDAKGGDPQLAGAPGALIQNVGLSTLDLRFSSLISMSGLFGESSDFVSVLDTSVGHVQTPETTISGSMFVNTDCALGEAATSNGHNLFTSTSCDLGTASDLIGVSPGKLNFSNGPDGGIQVKLSLFSRALDRVVQSAIPCPAADAAGSFRPQDGNSDGLAYCDIGAFENVGGRLVLEGGANGLFFSAGSDGHYVTIQQVRPNEYVVFWNTFDLNGNQAWIFGVGSVEEGVISFKGYFQPSGVLLPGSGADVDTRETQGWGTIEIELDDCLVGTFNYSSELPQFGSGSFNLDRLGLVEGVGCTTQD